MNISEQPLSAFEHFIKNYKDNHKIFGKPCRRFLHLSTFSDLDSVMTVATEVVM